MRKLAPVAFMTAGFLLLGGLVLSAPAHADDEDDSKGSSKVVPAPKQPGPKPTGPMGEQKRKELEDKYGKQGHLSLPPLVIRPKRESDELSESSETDELEAEEGEAFTGAGATGGSSSSKGASTGGAGVAAQSFISTNPATNSTQILGSSGTAVNPERNIPIDISSVKFSRKSPADTFIQAAQVGLVAMGVGAVALTVVAATRSIRRK